MWRWDKYLGAYFLVGSFVGILLCLSSAVLTYLKGILPARGILSMDSWFCGYITISILCVFIYLFFWKYGRLGFGLSISTKIKLKNNQGLEIRANLEPRQVTCIVSTWFALAVSVLSSSDLFIKAHRSPSWCFCLHLPHGFICVIGVVPPVHFHFSGIIPKRGISNYSSLKVIMNEWTYNLCPDCYERKRVGNVLYYMNKTIRLRGLQRPNSE